MAVIDASVYVAIINANEPDHANSLTWFRQAQLAGETIASPAILLPEVSAALSRGMGDASLAHRVIQQLRQQKLVKLMPITATLAERAAIIAADQKIRGCDAVYVALAEQLGEALVTLDQQQLQRGAAVVQTRQP